jgi:hypothetical protein
MQWPTKSACPQCRLPVLEKRSDERGGSDGGRRTGEAQAAQTDEVQVGFRLGLGFRGSGLGRGLDGGRRTGEAQAAQPDEVQVGLRLGLGFKGLGLGGGLDGGRRTGEAQAAPTDECRLV